MIIYRYQKTEEQKRLEQLERIQPMRDRAMNDLMTLRKKRLDDRTVILIKEASASTSKKLKTKKVI